MAYVQAPDKFIFTANQVPVVVSGLGTSEVVKFSVTDWEGGASLVDLYYTAQAGSVTVDIGDTLDKLCYFNQNIAPSLCVTSGLSR